MKPVIRKNCVMCGHNQLEDLHILSNFPIFMGTTSKSVDSDLYCDKIFSSCAKCNCVQLKKLIPLDILYETSHAGIIGPTWKRHHEEFCDFVREYVSGNVVEVGGSNLAVANNLVTKSEVDKYIVFDNEIFSELKKSDKIILREQFFDAKTIGEDVDVIIHTHLIEHLYTPVQELLDMCSVLKDGSYMMFAGPMIDKMLEDNFTNGFNFEHTYLLTHNMVKNILKSTGFEIIDRKKFSPWASFYVAKKNNKIKTDVSHKYEDHIKLINNFIQWHLDEIENITSKLDEFGESIDKTFIFGAHIFTQYLLNFGLSEKLFINVLDNDPKKIGNRLYGTELNVKSPKILKDIDNPIVVLKAAMYTEEIKKDIIENINPNTRFIL